jgi:hypothetical protein
MVYEVPPHYRHQPPIPPYMWKYLYGGSVIFAIVWLWCIDDICIWMWGSSPFVEDDEDTIVEKVDDTSSEDTFESANERLMAAMAVQRPMGVLAALDAGADVNHEDAQFGTPLVLAMVMKHERIAKLLLAAGADANKVSSMPAGDADVFRMTPLMTAVSQDNALMVKLLLEAGADVSLTCADKLTEIILISPSPTECATVDLKKDASPLTMACQRGRHGIVKMLLRAGASVDVGLDVLCQSVPGGVSGEWDKSRSYSKGPLQSIRVGTPSNGECLA